jgi:hypothetical protein
MCFNSYLENHKPRHTFLLEFIKLYETLKDRENELYYINEQKTKAEEQL